MCDASTYIEGRTEQIRKSINRISSTQGMVSKRREIDPILGPYWTVRANLRIEYAKLRFSVSEQFNQAEDSDGKLYLDSFRYALSSDKPLTAAKDFFVYEYHPHIGEGEDDEGETTRPSVFTVNIHLHPYSTETYPLKRLHFPCTLESAKREENLFSLIDWLETDLFERFVDQQDFIHLDP